MSVMAESMATDLSTAATPYHHEIQADNFNNRKTPPVDDAHSDKSERDELDSDREVESQYKFHSVSNMLNGDSDRQKFMDPNLSPETSKLLRDILHTRERKLFNQQLNFTNDRNYLNKFMQRDQTYMRNGDISLDLSMKATHDSSLSDSDPDQRDSLSPMDSNDEEVKVKRARVDSILAGMKHSPDSLLAMRQLSPPISIPRLDVMHAVNGERRQKRKQFMPMQHGQHGREEPPAKVRREDDFSSHLEDLSRRMYSSSRESHDQLPTSDSDEVDGCDVNKNVDFSRKDLKPNVCEVKDKPKYTYLNLDGEEVEPSHFIDRVCKLVKEQEIVPRDENVDSNVEKLAQLLKSEIRDVISSTVDTVVTRFLDQQKEKELREEREKLKASQRISPKPEKREKAKPVLDRPMFKPVEPLVNHYPEPFHAIPAHHPFHQFPFFAPLHQSSPLLLPKKEPEQNEPLSLVQPKKKRTKVTDTRLGSRAARSFLHEGILDDRPFSLPHLAPPPFSEAYSPIIPVSLPTSVAIPNPSLQHSDILSLYAQQSAADALMHAQELTHASPHHASPHHGRTVCSPAHRGPTPIERPASLSLSDSMDKFERLDRLERMDRLDRLERLERPRGDTPTYEASLTHLQTTTLTPMHLRKAKLMFFFVRYPSSAIIKAYFPDIQFNKNNTAQLVKWFSNFREFYYIQMEKYSRQALAEGVKDPEELKVTTDCELYRVLNLHYNRNNQIEVPEKFRIVAEATLREFFLAIAANKDAEQSWKKAIYKIIARMDDVVPEYFKSADWLERLSGQ